MRRTYVVVLTAAMLVTLTGCIAFRVSDEVDRAEIQLEFTADGGANVDLLLGGPPPHARLVEVGEAVAPALFPTAEHRSVEISGAGLFTPGDEYVEMRATKVYRPGRHPVAGVDTAAAFSVLRRHGYRVIDVSVGVPEVVAAPDWRSRPDDLTEDDWSWHDLVPGDPAPAGSVRLEPEPSRGMLELGMFAVGVVFVIGAAVAIRRRRRIVAAVSAGLACGSVVAGFPLAYETEHLAMAGMLDPVPLNAAAAIPITTLLVFTAALFILVVAAIGDRLRTRQLVFNPPPGWPPPPPVWRLQPGWRPDPAWPPPPAGWEFFVARKSDP